MTADCILQTGQFVTLYNEGEGIQLHPQERSVQDEFIYDPTKAQIVEVLHNKNVLVHIVRVDTETQEEYIDQIIYEVFESDVEHVLEP